MMVVRILTAVAWLAIVWVSVQAIRSMGADTAGEVFFGDFSHAWRAQFNTDFLGHLLLIAGWIAYREKSLLRGIPFGVASILFGGVFSFAYLFVATFTSKGDGKRFLLGRRVDSQHSTTSTRKGA